MGVFVLGDLVLDINEINICIFLNSVDPFSGVAKLSF